MIKSNFEDLRRRKAYEEKRKLPLRLIADETGLSLGAIHRVSSGNMEAIHIATVDTLCRYFGLTNTNELLEYVPEGQGGEAEQV